MILSFITGWLTLLLLITVLSVVQLGFFAVLGIVFMAIAAVLSVAVVLTSWATGRRPAQ